MRLLKRFRCCLVALVVLSAGCAKVNVEKSTTLEPGEFRAITIDPSPSNQRVNIKVTSVGAPIGVYVILETDQNVALKVAADTLRTNITPNAVDGRPKITDDTLTVPIPAKQGFSVLLINGSTKKTDVTVNIVGR